TTSSSARTRSRWATRPPLVDGTGPLCRRTAFALWVIRTMGLAHGLQNGDGMRIAWRWLPALLALVACLPVSARPTLELTPPTASAPLAPHLGYHHDASGSDRAEDAWRRVEAGGFAALPGGKDAFGFQSGAVRFP